MTDLKMQSSGLPSAKGNNFAVDVQFLIGILRKGWWIILLFVLFSIGLTLLLLSRITPVYKASATLQVKQQSRNIVDVSDVEQIVANREFLTTQVELLQSRKLIEDVVQSLKLKSDPYLFDSSTIEGAAISLTEQERMAGDALSRNLSVGSVGRSRLIEVTVEHTSPQRAALIANKLVETYIDNSIDRNFNSTSYARGFLEERLQLVKASLEDAERELVNYASENGILKLGDSAGNAQGVGGTLDSRELIELDSKLSTARLELFEAEAAYEAIKNTTNFSGVLESKVIESLRSRRTDLNSEYVEKLAFLKPDFPTMVELKKRIDLYDQELAAEISRVEQSSIESAKIAYELAKKKEQNLSRRVSQLKNALTNIQEKNVEYNILQRELETERSQYDALLQRLKEVSVSDDVGSNLIEIVDKAKIPRAPFKPNKLYALLFALLGSAGAGFALVFIRDAVNDKVTSPDNVKERLNQILMGVIPMSKNEGDIREIIKDPLSNIAEAYASLRTNLQFSGEDGGPRVIQLTSTRSGEGKSISAMGLATRYAAMEKKVLLIDADMRRPTFMGELSQGLTKSEDDEDSEIVLNGLAGLLTTRNAFETEIHESTMDPDNLHVIVAGSRVPNPAEILSNSRFEDLIAWARENYDYVIVDSPPILGLTDAPLIGAKVDASLLIVESGELMSKNVNNSIERLHRSGTNLLGVVLTKYKAPTNAYGYYDYNYGSESYGYGKPTKNKDKKSKSKKDERKIRV